QLVRVEQPMPAIIGRPEDPAAEFLRALMERLVRPVGSAIAAVAKDIEVDDPGRIDMCGHMPGHHRRMLVHSTLSRRTLRQPITAPYQASARSAFDDRMIVALSSTVNVRPKCEIATGFSCIQSRLPVAK